MPHSFPRDPPSGPRADSLYETDFHAWTLEQARLLRAGEVHRADLANIAEEIETLGRSERAALRSSYRLVALHLLELIFQKERASRRWLGTIARERSNAASLLEDNPSLKPQRAGLFAKAYADARKEASAETGLPLRGLPAEPPFTLENLLDETYLPNT